MFRGNHRTFFSSQYSCFRLDDCGNHSQLETCSRKSRAEYQNEFFSFFLFFLVYVVLLPPFCFFMKQCFKKKQEKLKKEQFTKYSAFPPIILLAGNSSQLFPIHQQSITFVLTMILTS